MKNKKQNVKSKIFGIFAYLSIFLVTAVPLPALWLLQWCILKKNRTDYWRNLGYVNAKIILWLCRIRVQTNGLEDLNTQDTFIYASNHPSLLDGFILFAILGPKVTSFTAPFESFPPPFGYWFRKMNFVEVRRDDHDDHKYKQAASKKQALAKAENSLKKKTSLIIFPEGHYERLKQLHYIHTGTARLAIRTNTPIVPISIVGLDKVLLGKFAVQPGRIIVTFKQPVAPKPYHKKYPYREASRQLSKRIREELVSILPQHYLPKYKKKDADKIGVFIDIDRTVYRGYSQQDFVKFLFKKGEIGPGYLFLVFYWIILEKFKLKAHRELMKDSLLLLKSWDTKRLHFLADVFFEEHLLAKVETHILPHIKDHHKQKHKIVLVTEVIHPLARLFRDYFKADAVLGTQLETKGNTYTGKVKYLCYQENKATVVKQFAARAGIDLNKSFVYADSISDLPMFQLVKHKIAVNPDDRLSKIAEVQDWSILK